MESLNIYRVEYLEEIGEKFDRLLSERRGAFLLGNQYEHGPLWSGAKITSWNQEKTIILEQGKEEVGKKDLSFVRCILLCFLIVDTLCYD